LFCLLLLADKGGQLSKHSTRTDLMRELTSADLLYATYFE
jgi:hypothetical protein